MLEKLVARIKELGSQLEASAANHKSMLGAMQELKALYNDAVTAAPIVEAIVPALTPEISAVEGIVNAAENVA